MAVFVDYTHVHRQATGLERISLELFSSAALDPIKASHITAASAAGLVLQQWIGMPWSALKRPGSVILCPGFPPSIALQSIGQTIIPYVHDLFVVDNPEILHRGAYYYCRPSFLHMLRKQSLFLVNSEKTRADLLGRLERPARAELYRPRIQNIFDLRPKAPDLPSDAPIRFVALGTVEPRKNYRYAADIIDALNARGCNAKLRIIGRPGWGPDYPALLGRNHIELLGYLAEAKVRDVVSESDILISTSLDEGLGLPLLELQYAGLLTVAADIAIFREIMEGDCLYVPRADASGAADIILQRLKSGDWRATGVDRALRILDRHNRRAARDRETVVSLIQEAERTALAAAGSAA
ncbi:glycosyltransferase [Methylocapsa polymorpha]|uniref:Glycosyltransferase n=1 Tax=Methylocapsa polymorpha TaxID=3080828 RepID=A0ABZ0HMY9_9HYPH|nr:glycosyltransferase [Methylocapsa sp. RX1]